MKKIDRHQTKLRLVLHHEVVLHLTPAQLAQAAGASGKTRCEGCRASVGGGASFQ